MRVTTARNAFLTLYLGRARALDAEFDSYDFEAWSQLAPLEPEEAIRTPSGLLRIPRVLLLLHYSRVPTGSLRLSRRNVLLRDDFTCQYCGEQPPLRDLNLDHVLPRARGGRSTWENLVTSCRDCNLRKGRALPHECGMLLRRQPVRPSWSALMQIAAAPRSFEEWEPFLAPTSAVASGQMP